MRVLPFDQLYLLLLLACLFNWSEQQHYSDDEGDEFSADQLKRRAIPMSGGVYGKRAMGISMRAIPMNGGMYGKRGAVPFSGGLYGKRSFKIIGRDVYGKRAMIPLSGGLYGRKRRAQLSSILKEVQLRALPLNGGMYGK